MCVCQYETKGRGKKGKELKGEAKVETVRRIELCVCVCKREKRERATQIFNSCSCRKSLQYMWKETDLLMTY